MSELAIRRTADLTPVDDRPTHATTTVGAMRLVEWADEARAAHSLALSLCKTPFAGSWKNDPEGATAAILKGAEVGLTPVTALGAFDNIQGRPAAQAITLRALVQGAGHDLEIVEETADRAVARYRRNGRGEWLTTDYTMDDAARAGLAGKDGWKKNPRAMLIARVTSKAARMVASDVILGIGHSAEELRDGEGDWDVPTPTRSFAAAIQTSGAGSAPAASSVGGERGDSPAPEPLTDKTRGRLFALLSEQGIDDEDEQRAGMSHILGRTVESRATLTEAEAQTVISHLVERAQGEWAGDGQ